MLAPSEQDGRGPSGPGRLQGQHLELLHVQRPALLIRQSPEELDRGGRSAGRILADDLAHNSADRHNVARAARNHRGPLELCRGVAVAECANEHVPDEQRQLASGRRFEVRVLAELRHARDHQRADIPPVVQRQDLLGEAAIHQVGDIRPFHACVLEVLHGVRSSTRRWVKAASRDAVERRHRSHRNVTTSAWRSVPTFATTLETS
jgi:hypothetical protein